VPTLRIVCVRHGRRNAGNSHQTASPPSEGSFAGSSSVGLGRALVWGRRNCRFLSIYFSMRVR